MGFHKGNLKIFQCMCKIRLSLRLEKKFNYWIGYNLLEYQGGRFKNCLENPLLSINIAW